MILLNHTAFNKILSETKFSVQKELIYIGADYEIIYICYTLSIYIYKQKTLNLDLYSTEMTRIYLNRDVSNQYKYYSY